MDSTHIGIVGNIGVGKTTLMTGLAATLDADVYHEGDKDNPFLEAFYLDPPRWALASATFFLKRAWQSQKTIRSIGRIGLQDRTVYDQLAVFVEYRRQNNILTSDECDLLYSLAEDALKDQPLPDLFIYVRATPEVAQRQIAQRSLSYEQGDLLPLDLLQSFHDLYEDWVETPWVAERLIVVEDMDLRTSEAVDSVVRKIKEAS